MPYFLSNNNLIVGEPASIVDEEANHILLARRARVGDELKVQGPDGKRFLAAISTAKKHEVVVVPHQEISVPTESPIKITLFQSVVASGTLDTVLQKATELGAGEIVLFNSQFTATRLSSEKFADKLPRFNKILWEAAKQCERVSVPILRYCDIKDVAAEAATLDQLFVFDITGQPLKANSDKLTACGLVIGPEGGLSSDELKTLSALPNAKLAKLGPLLLKADTAAVVALAIVNNI